MARCFGLVTGLALLILAGGCRGRRVVAERVELEGALYRPPEPAPKNTDPDDPEDTELPELPPTGRKVLQRAERFSVRHGLRRVPASEEPGRPELEDASPRPAVSSGTAGGPGKKPDEGEVEGDQRTRRPDDVSVSPAGPPLRYVSPAAVKRFQIPQRDPKALEEPAELAEDIQAGADDVPRAGFASTKTGALSEGIPETLVSDPEALGSYHVQVSLTRSFKKEKLVYDKVYPFMADIDLETDMVEAHHPTATYWVRYALVDLLGFEHSFTKPKRMILIGPD